MFPQTAHRPSQYYSFIETHLPKHLRTIWYKSSQHRQGQATFFPSSKRYSKKVEPLEVHPLSTVITEKNSATLYWIYYPMLPVSVKNNPVWYGRILSRMQIDLSFLEISNRNQRYTIRPQYAANPMPISVLFICFPISSRIGTRTWNQTPLQNLPSDITVVYVKLANVLIGCIIAWLPCFTIAGSQFQVRYPRNVFHENLPH